MSPGRIQNEGLEQALARAGDGAFAIGPDGRVAVCMVPPELGQALRRFNPLTVSRVSVRPR
jgi:hypothetical protein